MPEVLSVCTVQFKAVCDGCKIYVKDNVATHEVSVEGDTVSLDPTCGAFITMNPGYLGRSELPEGLKALFRPMTVMVPDLVLICENMLMAEGYVNAKSLASKFYGLYSLLKDLLSKQEHYDWGLRAVKSVLVVAGQLKRVEPDMAEDALLMRALRDFNVPKIVKIDEVVFFGLLNDLFPGINPPRVVDEELGKCTQKATEDSGLWPDEQFVLKVTQLDELVAIRHCVFVMGPPGAGKSTCWKTLIKARALKDPKNKVKYVDLNPKVLPTEDLYGHIHLQTREWKDGLLSTIMRDLGQIPDEKPKWIILDGDLDANWIESMNSVMDDNKMLTLASNERIPLKTHMRMIFEIRDLKYATPATVSRAGIIYLSTDTGYQWASMIASWVQNRPESLYPEEMKGFVHELFTKYVGPTLDYFRKNLRPVVPTEDTALVAALLRLLDSTVDKEVTSNNFKLETAFVWCAIWAFGSALIVTDDGTDHRKAFSDWWRNQFKQVRLPTRDTVFDYWLEPQSNKFEPWKASPAFRSVEFNSKLMKMSDVTVPTTETASITFWMGALVKLGAPVMLCGASGTGKTQLINGLLRNLAPEEHISTTINLNFYSSAVAVLGAIEAPLQKRTGSTFGPPGGSKMLYFVDDLNLPEVDKYNTQSAIALMRQHIDYTHWYDPAKLTIKTVVDCQYITAMNPTAGSFLVNPRLQRHFTTFAVSMPSATSLLTIYQTFLDGHLSNNGFTGAISNLSSQMIKGALALHKEVSETFRKTAANFHYEFNIRHLALVFSGLLQSSAAQFDQPEKFVFLWVHESERVYGDRLVNNADIGKFKALIAAQAKKAFPQYNVSRFYMDGPTQNPLIFCHFGEPASIDEPVYDMVQQLSTVRGTFEGALAEYNEFHAVMDLVLFGDAVCHVARITRIIKQPAGHAMLVGVGGSGKQSLARLAASLCSYSLCAIAITQTYGIADLKSDLQAMYTKAGVKQEGVLFLFTDNQITNERFLVYINDLLASANIPDLYTKDEQDNISNAVMSKAKAAGVPQDNASCFKYFISEVRNNLHVCLCFSPVGADFRTRATKFPALVNCTVIDWFQPWPEEALATVGKKFLAGLDFGENALLKDGIEKFMPMSFETVNREAARFLVDESRYVYTTPKSYLELLKVQRAMARNYIYISLSHFIDRDREMNAACFRRIR